MASFAPETDYVKRPIMGGSPSPKVTRRPPPIAAMGSKGPKMGPAQDAAAWRRPDDGRLDAG